MNPIANSPFPEDSPYRRLARTLDALPNGFPAAEDESDLRLLAKIFLPAEADLASHMLPEKETPAEICARLHREPREVMTLLKEMGRKGLIEIGKTADGRLGFGLMPFVVGIYEEQIGRIDKELAQLFEDYYQATFKKTLQVAPQFHRVVPVGVPVKNNLEIRPYESATGLIDQAQSWGVIDCICRTQRKLIGKGCGHPIDVCMVISMSPNAFTPRDDFRVLTHDEALRTLQRAADAGLVHCVSNTREDVYYVCNCCTCSCAILRGMSEMGIANVVAKSAFVNTVEEDLCVACGACADACPFHAIELDGTARVIDLRCTGCGVCISACPEGALSLVRRADAVEPPLDDHAWGEDRLAHRPLEE